MTEFSKNIARLISETALSHVHHGGWQDSPEGLRCAAEGALVVPTPEWLDAHVHEPTFEAFGWIGEDETGGGEIGFKAGFVPAGFIPLVAVRRDKIDRETLREQMQAQVNHFGMPYSLVRMVAVEEVARLEPERGREPFEQMTTEDLDELRAEAEARRDATAAVNRIRTLRDAGVPLDEAKVAVYTRLEGPEQERVEALWERYEEAERQAGQGTPLSDHVSENRGE